MGKTAMRLWKKMALVEPVAPRTGDDGFTQPGYLRGRSVTRMSPRVRSRNLCIANELHGKKFSGRYDVIQAFKKAVSDCKAAGQ